MSCKSLLKAITAAASLCAVLLFIVFPVAAEFMYTPITVEIPVSLERAGIANEDDYEIVIEPDTKGSPMPDQESITFLSGTRVFTFELDEPGTYEYRIYERAGSSSKIVYDSTLYTVTLFVTQDENGILESKVILSNGSLFKPSAVCFVNKASGSGSGSSVVATGEDVSTFVTLAIVAFAISGSILAIVLVRRKEDTYE